MILLACAVLYEDSSRRLQASQWLSRLNRNVTRQQGRTKCLQTVKTFTAPFLRTIFGRRDRRVKGPRADRALEVRA